MNNVFIVMQSRMSFRSQLSWINLEINQVQINKYRKKRNSNTGFRNKLIVKRKGVKSPSAELN